MTDRFYGPIPGVELGAHFPNRAALAEAGVHRPLQGGICGGADGAESIVVSGGYIDDQDNGFEIIYTGHGGKDQNSRRQTKDQELKSGNAGLARSHVEGYPIRVVRGAGGDPKHSPEAGYRYDGLYTVVDHWHDTGKDGFLIWRFRLVALDEADMPKVGGTEVASQPGRATSVVQRIVRDIRLAERVKNLHGHRCQVCGVQLETPTGLYAEAAHIRGLGQPHNGPDALSNLLCLCPNDHTLFDNGAIYVDSTWVVRSFNSDKKISSLRRVGGHAIDPRHVTYHREHYAPKAS